jgi:hypothetical protein
VLYDYGYYALGAPVSWLFVPYLLLMSLSAYTMIGIVASIDAAAIRARLVATVSARLVGGFLVGLALLFATLWSAIALGAAATGTPLDGVARVVTTLDLTVQLPALFAGGLLLWRGDALGCVVAAGLLLQASAYLIGLSIITVLQGQLLGAPIDPIAVVPGLIVGAISLGFIGTFVRAAAGDNLLYRGAADSVASVDSGAPSVSM